MLKHDLRFGIVKYIWVYIALAALVFCGGTYFFQIELQKVDYGELTYGVSGLSMLLFVFQGNERYVPSPENEFQLSMLWFLPLVLIGYSIYAYPVHDLKTYGYNYMIRTKSRARWWFAKCGWLAFHVLVCVAVMAFSAALCAWSKGQKMFEMPGIDLLDALSLSGFCEMDRLHIWGIFILMLVTLLAMSMLQMFFSFVFSSVVAYIGLIVMYVTSVYCTVWLLPGNYLILQRMQVLSGDGINQWIGVPFMMIVLILVLLGGKAYIKHRDIL